MLDIHLSTISQIKKEHITENILYFRDVIKFITDMKILNLFMLFVLLIISPIANASKDKREIPPPDVKWDEENDPDRSLSNAPSLFKDANFVYVYSEKQLDNVTIGITDMQGNMYHYEVTNVPACTYYAVSIESLPAGQYYLCVYQGSNYVIGIFQKH